MRLDYLKIYEFKNLKDISIEFDTTSNETVLIGENGTGKSNLTEAIIRIFKDLDLDKTTPFGYEVKYQRSDHKITIRNTHTESGKFKRERIVDEETLKIGDFHDDRKKYLPAHVFGYYSGQSSRMEALFDDHQRQYYEGVIRAGADQELNLTDTRIRDFFYCRKEYGALAFLTLFAYPDKQSKQLQKYLGIKGFESALITLKRPAWGIDKPNAEQKKNGDPRFWYARGIVRNVLDKLWEYSIAPISDTGEAPYSDYRSQKSSEEHRYLFIKGPKDLEALAEEFRLPSTFFSYLELLEISGLVSSFRIWVDRESANAEIPFHEISDGEKQLVSVIGMMKFTKREESLFVLDEPDTHLNPLWKWEYLKLIRSMAESDANSEIIITSHDPLTMGSLSADQVKVLEVNEKGKLVASSPRADPRGLGFTSILTQIFGLPTTLDSATQEKLDDRNRLLRIDDRTEKQDKKLNEISLKLRTLGFMLESREPEYELFLRAFDSEKRAATKQFSQEELIKKEEVARSIISKILADQQVPS